MHSIEYERHMGRLAVCDFYLDFAFGEPDPWSVFSRRATGGVSEMKTLSLEIVKS